ncbi:MAG: excinuclease ABC subunit C, partial [Alistipes onderdonkii]|nr:excinuclease ABC subunit C [Alistipes onderdonkii]
LLCGFPPVLVGIRPTSPLFHFLAHIQEEVHRFAVSFHRQKRSKAFIHSELERIEGVGDKTVRTLLQHFRTVAKVKAAPFEELTALVGPAKAKKIKAFFEK